MIKKKERGHLDKIKNAHVGFIHLAPPSGHCLAADLSQFVFGGGGSKGSAAQSFWTGTRPLLYLNKVLEDKGTFEANQVSLRMMIFHFGWDDGSPANLALTSECSRRVCSYQSIK